MERLRRGFDDRTRNRKRRRDLDRFACERRRLRLARRRRLDVGRRGQLAGRSDRQQIVGDRRRGEQRRRRDHGPREERRRILQPRRAEDGEGEHGRRRDPRTAVRPQHRAPHLVELRGEIGELRQVGIELDHLVERGSCLLQAFALDRLTRRLDSPIDAAALRTLLELRIAFLRDQRSFRRRCLDDRRGGNRRVDRQRRRDRRLGDRHVDVRIEAHRGGRRFGGHRRRFRGRLRRRQLAGENAVAQRVRGEEIRVELQRGVHGGERGVAIAPLERRARGTQMRLKSLPAVPCVHAPTSCKMSSELMRSRAGTVSVISARFLPTRRAARPYG